MDLKFAEPSRKLYVLLLRELLTAKEDYSMLEQSGADLGNSVSGVSRSQIDTKDLCPNRGRHRADIECSGVEPRSVECRRHQSLPRLVLTETVRDQAA